MQKYKSPLVNSSQNVELSYANVGNEHRNNGNICKNLNTEIAYFDLTR